MTATIELPSAAAATRGGQSSRRSRAGTVGLIVAAAALMAAGAACLAETWSDIGTIAWSDDESSQVLLVPIVAAWLFWVRRERLRGYSPSFTWAGPALIVLGWAMNQLGDKYLLQSVWHFGAVVVVVGGLISVAGGGFLVRFLPAFASLAFLVPVPGRVRQAIAIPLQTATAEVTRMSLETFGADVDRIGNMLRINGRDVVVVEACNGLRMVFALTVVSFAFAYGVPLRNWIRVLIVALSPVTAIFFNVVRLVPTIWAFGEYPQAFAQTMHDASAWVMLPVAFVSLLGLMRLLRWAHVPITPYVLAYGS
jgi:exosortase